MATLLPTLENTLELEASQPEYPQIIQVDTVDNVDWMHELTEISRAAESQRHATLAAAVQRQHDFDTELLRDIIHSNCTMCRDALDATAWIMDFVDGMPIDKTGYCNREKPKDSWQKHFLQWNVRKRLYAALDSSLGYATVMQDAQTGMPCNNCSVLRPTPAVVASAPLIAVAPVMASAPVMVSAPIPARSVKQRRCAQQPPQDLAANIVWRVPAFGTKASDIAKCAFSIIEGIRSDNNNLVAFKIGITQDLNRRRTDPAVGYKHDNYDNMHVLFKSNGIACALLEVLLISRYKGQQGCQNEAPGGEGIANGGEGVELCYTYVAVRYVSQFPPNDPRHNHQRQIKDLPYKIICLCKDIMPVHC